MFQYAPRPPEQDMQTVFLNPEVAATRAVQKEECRKRGKAARVGPLLQKRYAKAVSSGAAVRLVVLVAFAAEQQVPMVLVGASQKGGSEPGLQLPVGGEARKSVSSLSHALLTRVLQRPPQVEQLLDLGVKGDTGGFALLWGDTSRP